jgi:hypothetical protein
VNQARNVAQQRQDDIQNKRPAKPFADKYAKGWEQNSDNYAPKAHKLSCLKNIQLLVMKINIHFKPSLKIAFSQKTALLYRHPKTQKPAISGFFSALKTARVLRLTKQLRLLPQGL